jgi:hypothetical protein
MREVEEEEKIVEGYDFSKTVVQLIHFFRQVEEATASSSSARRVVIGSAIPIRAASSADVVVERTDVDEFVPEEESLPSEEEGEEEDEEEEGEEEELIPNLTSEHPSPEQTLVTIPSWRLEDVQVSTVGASRNAMAEVCHIF